MRVNLINEVADEDLMPTETARTCRSCGSGGLEEKTIETAFWRESGLAVIRGIPALVCPSCGEEFVEDRTAFGLDRMRGRGFSGRAAVDHVSVPVFEYVEPPSGFG
ncbi:type II toxin-antitoxin system MqsA family antitoxin [Histidinibacterium aquaticum]|nr:type II toxin-antitoxin system MqsA family antitoxin [Histidinibacterium aquaticum]